MTQEEKEKIAVWRYGIIASILNHAHTFESLTAVSNDIATRPFTNPVTNVSKCFSPRTIRYWVYLYKKGGLEALMPSGRTDAGKPRTLPVEAQEEIIELIKKYPKMPNTVLRDRLKEKGLINDSVSQSTVNRYIRMSVSCLRVDDYHEGKERKAFEYEYANQMWQADTTYLRKINGHQVFLMLIIDDASRMIVGYGFFYEDSAVNFQSALKKAILTYGKPSLLYTDNGAPYVNFQLERICADLQIQLVHCPIRDGASKGKIERMNKTCKQRWLRCIDWEDFQTLEDVQLSFEEYLFNDYLKSPHSSLHDEHNIPISPRERFFQDEQRIVKVSQERLNEAFLHCFTRKVRTDSTVKINNVQYEVPYEYISKSVTILLDATEAEQAWIKPDNSSNRIPIKVVNKKDNAHVKRKQHISFSAQEND
jgi:transposase InsO family protein